MPNMLLFPTHQETVFRQLPMADNLRLWLLRLPSRSTSWGGASGSRGKGTEHENTTVFFTLESTAYSIKLNHHDEQRRKIKLWVVNLLEEKKAAAPGHRQDTQESYRNN